MRRITALAVLACLPVVAALAQTADAARLGRWLDSEVFGCVVTFYEGDGALFVEERFDDDSTLVYEIVESNSPYGRRFELAQNTSPAGDYWIINDDGCLEWWDDDGWFSTSEAIK